MAITAADKAQQEKVTEDEILASLVILFDPPTDSICEFGDVTLIVDDALHPTLRMKVSSCILATSSKVFRALFSNKLSEDRSKEILLREPPRAMRMLCGLLHLQPLDEAPESLELLELAVLADKYDCTSSLGYAFKCILGDAKNSTSYSRLDHLVTAAYMVGQPKHFRDITKELVLHSVLRPDQVDERCLELLPPNLLASLAAQQAFARNELTLQITGLVNTISNAGQGTSAGHELMLSLAARGLWPLDHRRLDISTALAALDGIDMHELVMRNYGQRWGGLQAAEFAQQQYHSALQPEQELRSQRSDEWGDGNHFEFRRPSQPPPKRPFVPPQMPCRREVERIIAKVKAVCVGACLDCISGHAEQCREPHPHPWKQWTVEHRAWAGRPVDWEAVW